MMERHFHEELNELKKRLVEVAGLAEKMIDDSIRALVERDRSVLSGIDEMEEKVNRAQCCIDDTCVKLIALHQPTASDLRFIIGCIKANTDVERLADEAVNVSHKAARLIEVKPVAQEELVSEMAAIASSMVRKGIEVFVSGKASEARELIRRDQSLNDLKGRVTVAMLELIRAEPDRLRDGLDMILAARNLERIGDHVKNIAENAIYIAEGTDVRHHFEDSD
jgi:phosphate transport system protein